MPRTLVTFFFFVLCLWPLGDGTQAAGVSDAFFEAESCARALRKDPKAVKNPSAWSACIEKFQAVYRKEPKGPWAPPSLYNSGMLYMDLARQSGSESDKKAAIDQFEQLQKKFPDSGYRERVAAELQTLKTEPTPPQPGRRSRLRVRRTQSHRRPHSVLSQEPEAPGRLPIGPFNRNRKTGIARAPSRIQPNGSPTPTMIGSLGPARTTSCRMLSTSMSGRFRWRGTASRLPG